MNQYQPRVQLHQRKLGLRGALGRTTEMLCPCLCASMATKGVETAKNISSRVPLWHVHVPEIIGIEERMDSSILAAKGDASRQP
jgi:hypothetical protein